MVLHTQNVSPASLFWTDSFQFLNETLAVPRSDLHGFLPFQENIRLKLGLFWLINFCSLSITMKLIEDYINALYVYMNLITFEHQTLHTYVTLWNRIIFFYTHNVCTQDKSLHETSLGVTISVFVAIVWSACEVTFYGTSFRHTNVYMSSLPVSIFVNCIKCVFCQN